MTPLTPEQQKEYNDYLNEQFKILKGHFERIMLRCHNKLIQLIEKQETKK